MKTIKMNIKDAVYEDARCYLFELPRDYVLIEKHTNDARYMGKRQGKNLLKMLTTK